MDGSDGLLAGSWGAGGAPSSGQASQPPPPLLSGDAAVASTAANSGNEEEGELCNTGFRSCRTFFAMDFLTADCMVNFLLVCKSLLAFSGGDCMSVKQTS